MRRRVISIVISVVAAVAIAMAASPKYEMRGAWIATVYGIDWPAVQGCDAATAAKQKKHLDGILESLHDAGFNAVFFQVRPMADALYKSSREPWSAYLTGQRGAKPAYDPLEYCIAKAHEMGMECHAWINPFRVGSAKYATTHDLKHKHLWMTHSVKRSTMTIFNPALEETRSHLKEVCGELAENYDIDGIVFDDYFYNPEFLPEDDTTADYSLYKAQAPEGMTMADWRRANVDRAMREVGEMLMDIKEGKIRFGISPQGIAGGNGVHESDGVPPLKDYGVTTADSQYDKIYSDPVQWLKEGIVDYVSPQIYWPTTNPRNPYDGLSRWWSDVAEHFGRHNYPSINIVKIGEGDKAANIAEVLKEVAVNREASYNYAPGAVLYSASYLAPGKDNGVASALADDLFKAPALVPPMTWKGGDEPLTITGLRLDGRHLTWDDAGDTRYVVYAIPEEIDLTDALSADGEGFSSEYIVKVTYRPECELAEPHRAMRIAVTAYDRYGNEWAPTFLN